MTVSANATPSPVAPLPQFSIPAIIVWPLLAALFFFLCLRPVAPSDIYFLMLAGARTLDTGHVPHADFFLYTVDGQNQLFGGWGFGVLAELCNRIGGLIAVSCFSAALWSATFILGFMAACIRLDRRINQPFTLPDITALLFVGAAILQLVINRTQQRPEVTVYLIWCLGVLLFELDRRDGTRRALLIYPLLVWLEAWLHTAGPVLLLLPIAYLLDAIAQRWSTYKTQHRLIIKQNKWWLTSLFCAALLPVLNPNGIWQFYAHPVIQLRELAQHVGIDLPAFMRLANNDQFISTSNISEYLPFWYFPPAVSLFMSASALSIIIAMISPQRLLFLISTVPLAIYAALHVRGLGLWGMALLVPSTELVQSLTHRIDFVTKGRNRLRYHCLIILGLLIGLVRIADLAGAGHAPTSRAPFSSAAQIIRSFFPKGANIFASYLQGPCFPWLLGDRFKVPYTGHVMFKRIAAENHYKRLANAEPGWNNEITLNNINAIVMPTNGMMYGDTTPLLTKLAYSPDWTLAAIDPEGLTYLKTQESNINPLSPRQRLAAMKIYWLRVIDGVDLSDRINPVFAEAVKAHAQTELQRLSAIGRLTEPDLSRSIVKIQKEVALSPGKWSPTNINQPH